MLVDRNKFNACAICAHGIHTPKCPHPWNKPFEQWPREMLLKLRELVPDQYDD